MLSLHRTMRQKFSISTFFYWLALLLLGFFFGCAQIVAPTGGDDDEDPPVLDSLTSTANFQTNFTMQDIILNFDEWIVLKDWKSQVVVSPFLEGFEVRLKKKSVILEFGEAELKEDITYIINFGESIADFTVGNPVENLRMVFSTGDFIDSLSIAGTVKEAYSNKPIKDAVVLVHENLSDTTVLKNKPLYIARTNESGAFKIENMKSDTFQIFIVGEEARKNYLYEPGSETFAFLDSNFILTDTTSYNFNFRMSKTEKGGVRRMDTEAKNYGKVKVVFGNDAENIAWKTEPDLPRTFGIAMEDSLLVYYHNPDTIAWKLILNQDTAYQDTIEIKSGLDLEDADLNFELTKEEKSPVSANPTQSLKLQFTQPIHRIDSSLISLRQDSIEKKQPITIAVAEDKRELEISHKWKFGKKYKLEILPGALESIHQRTNDTISTDYLFKTAEDLSNLKLELKLPDSLATYIFTLELGSGKVVEQEILTGQSTYELSYVGLDPIDYTLRVIEEKLVNGKWDPVDYATRRQPERVVVKKLGKLLANFDREEEWIISFE